MLVIPVRVFGDHWVNAQEVHDMLKTVDANTTVRLRLFAEGCSLAALGVVSTVQQYCNNDQVEVDQWSNSVESIPFKRINEFLYSHFFWMSKSYWPTQAAGHSGQKRLGYFVGRRSYPRQRIMYDLYDSHAPRCLFSIMSGAVPAPESGINLESSSQWLTPEIAKWWNDPPIGSLDQQTIRDQYTPGKNTNQSLLRWYSEFGIELVAETYCRGDCYFVTEKTVRPLSAAKPILVFGPRNFLRRLRDQGFRTYHESWDETYDQLEGVDRWNRMRQVIDHLMSLDQRSWQTLLETTREIALHNRQHLQFIIDTHGPQE